MELSFMPSIPATRADDKRLAEPGKKVKKRKKGSSNTVSTDTVMARYERGELKVSEMDDEEIKNGWFRNESGGFNGKRPTNVPRKFFDELRRESIKRWEEALSDDLEPMRDVLREIALNPRAPADARFKSAVYLTERVVGKVPEKNEVKVSVAPWEANIEGLLVDAGEEEQAS